MPASRHVLPPTFQPQAAHDFYVRFHAQKTLFDDESVIETVASQVSQTEIDFVGKTITVLIRETTERHTFDAVNFLSENGAFPEIQLVAGSRDKHYGLMPQNPKLIAHHLCFDYANYQCLMHKMVWSFSRIRSVSPRPEPFPQDR